MASMAESSINTVPFERLQYLREDLLLQQQQQQQPEASADVHASGGAVASPHISGKPATVQESEIVYGTPSSSSPTRVTPRLPVSKSAPPGEAMEAMVEASPSQDAFRELTRASSFHGYPGGDTQPNESQVYRDYRASMLVTTPMKQKTVLRAQISPDGRTVYEVETGGRSPNTFVEGDVGYVDLGHVWAGTSPRVQSPSSLVGELLASPDAVRPQTPSLAGRKHSRDGEVLTSEVNTHKKTPGFTQMFAGVEKGPVMTATQLFDQTQAVSSPNLEAPRSDPVVTRPSPNLQRQETVSSPIYPASSPVATLHRRSSAQPGEPRDWYKPLRESQEERAARLRWERAVADRVGSYLSDNEGEDDEMNDTQQRRLALERRRRGQQASARQEWQQVRAPSRPGSRPTSSPKAATTIDLVTPLTEKKMDVEFEISDQEEAIDDEEVPVEVGVEGDEPQSGDEYDELAQTVLRSQGPGDEFEEGEERASAVHIDEGGSDAYPPHTVENGHQIPTQPSAIADSQPLREVTAQWTGDRRVDAGPSLSSFVPRSQYAGNTSMEQTVLSSQAKPVYNGVQPEEDKVPSSPPLSPIIVDDSAAQLPTKASNRAWTAATPQAVEIPESDLGFSNTIHLRRTNRVAANKGESNSNQRFSTAQTHVSFSGPTATHDTTIISPLKPFASQQSKSTSQTPRTAAGVLHFAEIANGASTPRGSGETEIDVDAIMSDVLTAEDEQVLEIMGSPSSERAQKRRRIVDVKGRNAISSPSKTLPSKSKRTRFADGKAVEQARSVPASELSGDATSEILQDNPNRANELRPATPSPDEELQSTAESVKKREDAGAKHASLLLLRRTSRVPKPSRLKATSNAKSNKSARANRLEASAASEVVEQSVVIDETIVEETADADAEAARTEEVAGGQQEQIINEPQVDPTARVDTSNMVLALFKGSFNSFYPAIYLGASPDGRQYEVQFLDGNDTWMDKKHVRRFELRVGDVVRIDDPAFRGKSWIVETMGRVGQGVNDGADVNGYATVFVRPKTSRSSGAGTAGKDGVDNEVEVSTALIYLPHSLWTHYTDRDFKPTKGSACEWQRVGTPTTGVQTPNALSPPSRSRRTGLPSAKALAGRTSHLREESVISSSPNDARGLFTGMAFAISYVHNEGEKAEVSRMIVRNGGMVLETGFEALFDLPDLDDSAATSPGKTPGGFAARSPLDDGSSLQLKPQFAGLGFVALIADKHSRRAKYVQALALGLPTLSGKWIADSLHATKNPSISRAEATPVAWAKYLLPAGESSYLGGATRSRTITLYDAADAKLADTITRRDSLLNGDGVLIVAPRKGKAVWEKRKPYAFLTLALGASGVKRVADLAEAKAYVHGEGSKWKWVYVDGAVSEAGKVMFPEVQGGGKKRKRDGGFVEGATVDKKAVVAGDAKVRVVNDEFVVQSLILGALVD